MDDAPQVGPCSVPGARKGQIPGYTLRVFAKVASGRPGKNAVTTLNAQKWVLRDTSHRKFANPAIADASEDDRR